MEEIKRALTGILVEEDFRLSSSGLIRAALKLGHSFSLYRLPHSDTIMLIINIGSPTVVEEVELEEMEEGFLIAPFEGRNQTWLSADLSYCSNDPQIHISPTLSGAKLDGLQQLINEVDLTSTSVPDFYSGEEYHPENSDPESEYVELVDKAIRRIQEGVFEKVVPARSRKVKMGSNQTMTGLFYRLAELYKNAFTYLCSIQGVGTWLGASPELLLRTSDNSTFETMSLAGTQPVTPDLKLSKVTWTQKEIEEQAMVSRYVINCFKKIRLREFEEHGPKTVVAGNLMHLKTTFKVDMKATNFAQLGSVMLKLLHPTSAVCGLPKDPALNFIRENEDLDRAYYSGFLGPVNMDNSTDIFVNLRCLQWQKGDLILYAGAGITEDSESEQELMETELKFRTLLNVIEATA